MADKEKKDSKEENNENVKQKKSPVLLIVIILVALIIIGGVVAFFVFGKKDDANANKEVETEMAEEQSRYEVQELDTFVVNLAKPTTYLRTTILVEYDPSLIGGESGTQAEKESKKEEGEEEVSAKTLPKIFEKREAMIRDAVINTLSYKTPEELLTQDGKEALREELIDAINDALAIEDSVVVAVYFKEFIMQ
ncbi:MAG: flagellar basal body-associated FliL family protein [Bdellovibrionota bacterium]